MSRRFDVPDLRGKVFQIESRSAGDTDRMEARFGDLAPGAVVAIRSRRFDPASARGEGTLALEVTMRDGRPAGGAPWSVTAFHPNHGEHTVAEGRTDGEGRAEITGLRAGRIEAFFRVYVGEHFANQFDIPAGSGHRTLPVRRPPPAGLRYDDLAFAGVSAGGGIDREATVSLRSLRGKVVVLSFWATWCGWCKEPLRELDEIAGRRGVDWGDRVVIASVSIDSDVPALERFLAKRPWTALRSLWCPRSAGEKRSEVERRLVIRAVPVVLLLDLHGAVHFRGHPNDLDVEATVDDFLAAHRPSRR